MGGADQPVPARRRGGPADQGGGPQALGPLRPVRRGTFNVTIPAIPYEQLEELDDEGQIRFVLDAVESERGADPGRDHRAPAHVVSGQPGDRHRRHIQPYDGHVTLYMADRYHDDAIMFEPRYAVRKPDGGWGEYVTDIEVVPIGGEHIQAIDEPIIAKVGEHMSRALDEIEAEQRARN